MARYEFVPNALAVDLFKITAKTYTGSGVTAVLKEAFGEEIQTKHAIAKAPMQGRVKKDRVFNVSALLNPSEPEYCKQAVASVGTLRVLSI